MIANVYVDGFNLYNGALKGTAYKWLDLSTLVHNVIPGYSLNRIRFYTALVLPTPANPNNIARQRQYLRALRTIPGLSIHRGQFMRHTVMRPIGEAPPWARQPINVRVVDSRIVPSRELDMPLASYGPGYPRHYVPVIDVEEKGSDVNIATHLLWDAVNKEYDTAILVSNDSDLLLPIKITQDDLAREVVVINPHKDRPSKQLKKIANRFRDIRETNLAASQFPRKLRDGRGEFEKPTSW